MVLVLVMGVLMGEPSVVNMIVIVVVIDVGMVVIF